MFSALINGIGTHYNLCFCKISAMLAWNDASPYVAVMYATCTNRRKAFCIS